MPSHREYRPLPYCRDDMFALVVDVARYPEFLPWCMATRIRERSDTHLLADMVIGFKGFSEQFTSRVLLDYPRQVLVSYEEGPFKYLKNEWRFVAEENGCGIDFYVDFEFRSRLLELTIGKVFAQATKRMVGAFEARADALYGTSVCDA